MPQQPLPSTLNVTVPALTNFVLAFGQKDDNFVTRKAQPSFTPVDRQSGPYYTFPSATWNKPEMKRRGIGEFAATGGWTNSSDTYSCKKDGIRIAIDWDVDGYADYQVKPSLRAAKYIENQIRMKLDSLLAANILLASAWTTQITGVASGATTNQINQWNGSTSDPQEDVLSLMGTVKGLIGENANTMIVGDSVHRKIITNAAYREAHKYTAATDKAQMEKQIAAWLGLDTYIVAGAIQNSAKEGQSATLGYIIDAQNAWLGYMENGDSAEQVLTAFRVFAFTGGDGAMANRYNQGVESKVYDEPARNCTWHESNLYVDMKVVSADAGVYITDAVA